MFAFKPCLYSSCYLSWWINRWLVEFLGLTVYLYIYILVIHQLGWWSPTKKWLIKMLRICDFCQLFHIANIFWSRMPSKNYENSWHFCQSFFSVWSSTSWRITLIYIYIIFILHLGVITIEPTLDPNHWTIPTHRFATDRTTTTQRSI
jgi:hypothetical protein